MTGWTASIMKGQETDKISCTCYSWHAEWNLPSLKNEDGYIKDEFSGLCKIWKLAVHSLSVVTIHLVELTIQTYRVHDPKCRRSEVNLLKLTPLLS